jgi:hypothetical protein
MELNEALVKVDSTLEATTKKVEKLAKEMSLKDIVVEVPGKGEKKQEGKALIVICKFLNSEPI